MVSLTPEQVVRKEELTQKLQRQIITIDEAIELRHLLEAEKQEAVSLGDLVKALGIIFLIGLVIAFLTDDKK